jgi:hypothetical protein
MRGSVREEAHPCKTSRRRLPLPSRHTDFWDRSWSAGGVGRVSRYHLGDAFRSGARPRVGTRDGKQITPRARAPVRVVQQRVQVPVPTPEPRNVGEWVELFELLATRLVQGRIYTRDLPALVPTINRLIDVTDRRLHER